MIENIYLKMKEINQGFEKLLKDFICLDTCISPISTYYNGEEITLDINFYTLDIMNKEEIPRSLSRELFILTEDEELIRNSTRVERRTFCDFLALKYPDKFRSVLFLDQESPDYIVLDDGKQHAFELVEATNPREAQFNTMCRKNTGRGKTKEEYRKYLKEKHKQLGGSFSVDEYEGNIVLSPFLGMVGTCRTRKQIVDAIVKKVHKYKEYNIECDAKNILVFFSTLGFDNEFDFKQVGSMISEIEEVRDSDIRKIFVVSGMYQTLVEYNSEGNLIDYIINGKSSLQVET